MVVLTLTAAISASASAVPDKAGGWVVNVSSSILAPKAGFYSVTVTVHDDAGRPVPDAGVSLRVPDSPDPDRRLVPARHIGKGRYWTTVMAQRDWQRPLRVTAIVTRNPLGGGRLSLGLSATARSTVSVFGSASAVAGSRDVVPFQTPDSLHCRPLLTIVLPRGGVAVPARTDVNFAPHESLPGAPAGPRSIVSGRSPRSATGGTVR